MYVSKLYVGMKTRFYEPLYGSTNWTNKLLNLKLLKLDSCGNPVTTHNSSFCVWFKNGCQFNSFMFLSSYAIQFIIY